MPKGGLGRGLEALLPDKNEADLATQLPVAKIQFRKEQPRKKFDPEAMSELVASIKEHGVLQPILVRPHGTGYEVVAGERRLRAVIEAGLQEVPAVIRDLSEAETAEIALVENLQREDLTPVEEAAAYREMIQNFGYTQEQISSRIGRSRAYVANMLRLLSLPPEVLAMVDEGSLTAGHARALVAMDLDNTGKIHLARLARDKGYNVRQMEQLAREASQKPRSAQPKLTPEYMVLQEKLQDALGTKAIITRGKKGGRIEISFYSDDDLQRIIELLNIEL